MPRSGCDVVLRQYRSYSSEILPAAAVAAAAGFCWLLLAFADCLPAPGVCLLLLGSACCWFLPAAAGFCLNTCPILFLGKRGTCQQRVQANNTANLLEITGAAPPGSLAAPRNAGKVGNSARGRLWWPGDTIPRLDFVTLEQMGRERWGSKGRGVGQQRRSIL